MKQKIYNYDVALSFAGEDREYVEEVAKLLRQNNIIVFYDAFEKANLWGKDIYIHLQEVYRDFSNYAIIFCSKYYAKKGWTKHELKSAQERDLIENSEYILPAKFDKTEIPGISSTTGYIDLKKLTPSDFVKIILQKIGKKELPISTNNTTTLTLKEKTLMYEIDLYSSQIEELLHSLISIIEFEKRIHIDYIENTYHKYSPLNKVVKDYQSHIWNNLPKSFMKKLEYIEDINCKKKIKLNCVFKKLWYLMGSIDKLYFNINSAYWDIDYRNKFYKELPEEIIKTQKLIFELRLLTNKFIN